MMEREHISAEEGFTRLRRGSVATGTPLGRYAKSIVDPPSRDPDRS
jgi:AmiR/NasT family two-component response regulator